MRNGDGIGLCICLGERLGFGWFDGGRFKAGVESTNISNSGEHGDSHDGQRPSDDPWSHLKDEDKTQGSDG